MVRAFLRVWFAGGEEQVFRDLIIEDSRVLALLYREILDDCDVSVCRSALEAQSLLAAESVDIAILDCHWANSEWQPLSEDLVSRGIPVIVVTADPEAARMAAVMRAPRLDRRFDPPALRDWVERLTSA